MVFVEYFVFGYLKHIVGKDVGYIETMHATALKRLADGSRTYPDTWTEMCEGEGGLISQGMVDHYHIELSESKDQTAAYNEIWRQISPGTIIRFGNDTSEYIHYAVYIGTYNNIHYVAHVGNDRGPEIFIAEHMAANNGPKSSLPIDFYEFHFQDPYGAIQVVKSNANNGTKLAGAYFLLVNQSTKQEYILGPTNEMGYVVTEYTAEQDKATRFRCSTDANLRISGLAPDTYLLDHTETHSGYNTISDVEISLTADIPTVNGTALTIQTDPATGNAIYSFPILIPKYFDLPMGKCDLICWSYGTFGFDIITPLLCAGTIGCSIAIFFVIRSSRKK